MEMADDDLACVDLPDFKSSEVGPILSLLYFGEIWVSKELASACREVLDALGMRPSVSLETVQEISVPVVTSVRVKMEELQQQQDSKPMPAGEVSLIPSDQVPSPTEFRQRLVNMKKEAIEKPVSEDEELGSEFEEEEEMDVADRRWIDVDVDRNEEGLIKCTSCKFTTFSLSSLQV